jgi:hypothetical protein
MTAQEAVAFLFRKRRSVLIGGLAITIEAQAVPNGGLKGKR